MYLQYNGVNLELLQLDRVERDAVYSSDGQDLMYIRWKIGAACVFSAEGYPVGTAVQGATIMASTKNEVLPPNEIGTGGFSLTGENPNITKLSQEANTTGNYGSGGGRGENAIWTDAELRTRLWIPRKTLLIWGYDRFNGNTKLVWLESPKPGFVCDINGGPKPLAIDIVGVQGEGHTFGVHMQIETYASPCPYKSDRLVLSHRWEMSHDHDADFYLTRTIRGEIVFNQAFVQTANYRPDWVRNQLFHPIPLGFKRTLGPIVQSSDGMTINYTIYDTDTSITFSPGDSGATTMEIVENLSYMQPWRIT